MDRGSPAAPIKPPSSHPPTHVRTLGVVGVVVGMQFHVHLPKVQLAEHGHPGVVVLQSDQFLKYLLREGFVRLIMLRKPIERGFVVAPVLHELRRELHRVPFHACCLDREREREKMRKMSPLQPPTSPPPTQERPTVDPSSISVGLLTRVGRQEGEWGEWMERKTE